MRDTHELYRQIIDMQKRLRTLETRERALSNVYCRVYNDAAQTISNDTATVLTYNSETTDPLGFHSTVSNTSRLTVPAGYAGFYIIGGQMGFAANSTGLRYAEIILGGSTLLARLRNNAPSATNVTTLNVITGQYLSATNYVELRVYQNSGGDLDSLAASNIYPRFWLARVP